DGHAGVELAMPALRRAVLLHVRRPALAHVVAPQPVRAPLHALRAAEVGGIKPATFEPCDDCGSPRAAARAPGRSPGRRSIARAPALPRRRAAHPEIDRLRRTPQRACPAT